jgi:hypothetical protein
VASSFAPREQSGALDARGSTFGVVCARWNPTVTDAMLASALDALERHGARGEDVLIVRVPGAFELPAAVRALHESEAPDAVIALGAIVLESLGPQPPRYGLDEFVSRYVSTFGDEPLLERLFGGDEPPR